MGADGARECLGSRHVWMREQLVDGMALRQCPEDTHDSTIQNCNWMPPKEECHVQEELQDTDTPLGPYHVL